jgi:hypothetical protein
LPFTASTLRSTTTAKQFVTESPAAVKQDAALVAWLTSRAEQDDRQYRMAGRRPIETAAEKTSTSSARALDYAFAAVGSITNRKLSCALAYCATK